MMTDRALRQRVEEQTHPPSSILRFPNEMLRHIFTYCVGTITTYASDTTDPRRPLFGKSVIDQLFVLRAVNHRFRAVANGLSIWYDPDFEFVISIPFGGHVRKAANLIRALLADKDLVPALGRRTSWTFYCIENLLTVITDLPSFTKIVSRITLADMSPDIVDDTGTVLRDSSGAIIPSQATCAIEALTACQNITSLSLRGLNVLAFNKIAPSCPSLEELDIADCD